MSLCVCSCFAACACKHLQGPEEGIGSLEAGVTGHCELPNVAVGNPTLVHWTNRKPS